MCHARDHRPPPPPPPDRSFGRAALELGWWLVLHLCAPYVALTLLEWLIPAQLSVKSLASDAGIERFVVEMACYSSWGAWAMLPFSRSPVAKKFFSVMVFAPIPFYSFVLWACLSPAVSNLGFLAVMMLPTMYVSSKLLGLLQGAGSKREGRLLYAGFGSVFLLVVFALLGLVFSGLGVLAILLGSTFHALMAFVLMTVVIPGGLAARVSGGRESG